jgi:hypothetical protein
MLKRTNPIIIITPKITLDIDTALPLPLVGNKKLSKTTDKAFELLTIVIRTKFTPTLMLRFVKNIPVNTRDEVMITYLSKSMFCIVYLRLFVLTSETLLSLLF